LFAVPKRGVKYSDALGKLEVLGGLADEVADEDALWHVWFPQHTLGGIK